MREVTAEFMRVTPTVAKEWLERSRIKNRDWRPGKMKAFQDAMQRGKFLLNGKTIVFDQDGNILDGHHRLHACVLADVSFDALVVRGIDAKVMHTFDTGANRDVEDDLTISSPAHRLINRRVEQRRRILSALVERSD
jgi:hypothetical protein